MVVPAQFQLSLELPNIVNPISQAMSALGSLAVMDVIKKSGSDFVTETKLANLIGRHRIDPVIEFHFRQMVATSEQSMISRYMDIILESGSGPTVQEALKNPALFSMVIQLSALAFAHDNEALANILVEAIEKIVKESNSDICIVPDYVSLLGTLRACQQQTVAFRWALLYEATEEKIRKVLASPNNQTSNQRGAFRFTEMYEYERCRALSVAVLQGLLMWLHSLQSFPEHRLLNVICNTGLSTVVVWCHHVLGLCLMINIREMEICFGDGPYNLIVVHSTTQHAGVSLMDPLDLHEPLFTLQNDQHSTSISYDHRAEAYGYGTKFLQYAKVPKREQVALAQFIRSRTVEVCGQFGTSNMVSDSGLESTIDIGPRYPSRSRLLSACRFLFSDESAKMPKLKPSSDPHYNQIPIVQALVAIVITFARVSEDDLARCKEMPLALNVLTSIRNKEVAAFTNVGSQVYFDLLESFELLSLLLLGHIWYHDYGNPTVLFSAWGWSAFLDSIDDIDPFDVSINTLRVMRGVPSRQGIRRNRIIDGPPRAVAPGMWRSLPSNSLISALAAGIGRAERDIILVGHHNDAFQVTQQFTCRNQPHSPYRYGFRAMAEWSIRSRRFPPCQCYISKREQPSGTKLQAIDRILKEDDGLTPCSDPKGLDLALELERVFSSNDRKNLFTYVSNNPAARWLQLAVMYGENEGGPNDWSVVLAGRDTCVACAIRNGKRLPSPIVFLL